MKNFIRWSIILCSILGVLLHFLYEFSGQNFIIGLVTPTNESVFEHTKLLFTPITLIWSIAFLFKFYNKRFFIAQTSCMLYSILIMLSLFYLYTGAFGIESIMIDIIIFFISVIVSHILAYHIYKHLKSNHLFSVCLILYLLTFVFIIYFTLYPLNLPIFISKV